VLIYSIAPMEALVEPPELPKLRCCRSGFGFVSGYDTPTGFQITRLHSTDPSVYLRGELAPGKIWQLPGGQQQL
jgi:hypothetical protein